MIRYLEDFLILFLKSTHIDWLSGYECDHSYWRKSRLLNPTVTINRFTLLKVLDRVIQIRYTGEKTIFRLP